MMRKDKPRRACKAAGRARKVLERPRVAGWRTSDADEVEIRRWRGRTEILAVEALEPAHPVFGTFRVESGSGSRYEVEIHDLERPANACGCVDHRVNGLGTCKHIEGVLAALAKRGARAYAAAAAAGSPRIEVYLRRDGPPLPEVAWPADVDAGARAWLAPYLAADGTLRRDADSIGRLVAAAGGAPPQIRVSRHFGPWLDRQARLASRHAARAAFLAEVEAGEASWDVVKHPLLPYQKDGVMHLAFGERALLADEMGLGKTVQAIAACELLAQRRGIGRVLVVCPASVKAEWEEQIGRFSGRTVRFVVGLRPQRLAAYRDPAFFSIVNYEQVLNDADDLNRLLRTDVVILDEAQRIKNWQTKTARKVKSLVSLYAFVLTGTPIENRIDEAYSIVQFLDPEVFGPLFRFNRDFYRLDERGRPVDYRNMEDMHQRLGSVMLRRRKADVEGQLPGRTVKTFFVPMADEQRLRYEDFRIPAARLAAQAQRRPLTKEEFDRLQRLLACMRMICDTPAILDPTCRICPKLEELEGVLADLLEEPGRKVIVFSEWERMLQLVRELAGEMGVECAWHTGQVPQARRRAEIARFKQDPACRLFLSTDSGSVGLNLQAASAVVNVDQPWNPAKLEQRIARAWRKHQTRTVTVVNLVTEDSIEHSILSVLAQKQALADGLLDGTGDLAKLGMPSGRAALVERIQAVLGVADGPSLRTLSPEEALVEDLKHRHGEALLLVERRGSGLLVVLDNDAAMLAAERDRQAVRDDGAPAVEVIDRAAWQAMQRLAAAGLVALAEGAAQELHRAAAPDGAEPAQPDPATRAAALLHQADRSARMAAVLAAGGFAEEAVPLLGKALALGAGAALARDDDPPGEAGMATPEQIRALAERGALPAETLPTLAALRANGAPPADVAALAAATGRVLAAL
jgi:superfamily II DNA or RNA helicase